MPTTLAITLKNGPLLDCIGDVWIGLLSRLKRIRHRRQIDFPNRWD